MKGIAGKQTKGVMTGTILDVVDNSGDPAAACLTFSPPGMLTLPDPASIPALISSRIAARDSVVFASFRG